MKNTNKLWIVIIAVIGVAALIRLLPHPFNFTPIGALALFSGSLLLKRKWALALPLGSLILSDAIMEYFTPGTGFYEGNYTVYGSFLLVLVLGFFLNSNKSLGRVLGLSLVSSLLFFLITNFGVWASGTLYPTNFVGLMTCYKMGLPFLRNGLMGDLFYNSLFFGSFYLVSLKVKSLQKLA